MARKHGPVDLIYKIRYHVVGSESSRLMRPLVLPISAARENVLHTENCSDTLTKPAIIGLEKAASSKFSGPEVLLKW